MNNIIVNIINIVFWLLIIGFVIISLLSIYILNSYGRSKKITIIVSVLFGVFLTASIATAFLTLHNIIQKYA